MGPTFHLWIHHLLLIHAFLDSSVVLQISVVLPVQSWNVQVKMHFNLQFNGSW